MAVGKRTLTGMYSRALPNGNGDQRRNGNSIGDPLPDWSQMPLLAALADRNVSRAI
jgi:hypothetical protein